MRNDKLAILIAAALACCCVAHAQSGGGGGSGNATSIQGRAVASTAPTDTQVLCWVNADLKWEPCTGGGVTSIQFDSNTALTGAVTWTSGVGVNTTQSGQNVTVAVNQASTSLLGAVVLAGDIGGTYNSINVLHLSHVTDGSLPISGIGATGTPSSTTYLRGDGSWAAAGGGGAWSSLTNPAANLALSTGTYTSAWTITGNTPSATNVFQFTGNNTNTGTGAIIGITQGGSTDPLVGLQINQASGNTNPGLNISGASGGANMICVSSSGTACDEFSVNRYGNIYAGGTVEGGSGLSENNQWHVSAGILDKYLNISTVNNGQPAEYGAANLSGQTAAIATTTLYAVPATAAEMYKACYYLTVTTAGTGGTSPSITVTIGWNDGNAQTATASTTDLTVGAHVNACVPIVSAVSQNITYATTINGSPTGAPTYLLHALVEAY